MYIMKIIFIICVLSCESKIITSRQCFFENVKLSKLGYEIKLPTPHHCDISLYNNINSVIKCLNFKPVFLDDSITLNALKNCPGNLYFSTNLDTIKIDNYQIEFIERFSFVDSLLFEYSVKYTCLRSNDNLSLDNFKKKMSVLSYNEIESEFITEKFYLTRTLTKDREWKLPEFSLSVHQSSPLCVE